MLIGTAVFVGLLVALLAIPITLRFDVAWDRTLRQDVRLRWAFGLLDVRLGPRAKGSTGHLRGDDKAPKRKPNMLRALRVQRFRRRILRFAGALWRAVQKDDVSVRVRIGLGDPADTGQLWALLGPVAAWLATFRDASIELEPEFSEPALELETHGSVRVIPLQLLGIVAALALSPALWQGIRVMRAPA